MKSFSVLFNHIARDMGITTGQLGMYIGMYHAVTIMSGKRKTFLDSIFIHDCIWKFLAVGGKMTNTSPRVVSKGWTKYSR